MSPYAMQKSTVFSVAKLDKVKAKINEIVKGGKLKEVDNPTESCSNLTVREKELPDGSTKVRICHDPSQTINKAIIIPHYQIPTTQEIHNAYDLAPIAHGISNAPEDFQLRIHEALEGLQDVFCIADDILVVGQGDTRKEADKNHDEKVLTLMN